jgi:hypothetical protein
MGETTMERFIRRENVNHFQELLKTVKDEAVRQRLLKLLAEERQKQKGCRRQDRGGIGVPGNSLGNGRVAGSSKVPDRDERKEERRDGRDRAVTTNLANKAMRHVKAPAISYRNLGRIAAAVLIAGAALAFTSGHTNATPNKVTASKPCGSCHPPNKPPKRK